jgi:hypothetical protein
MAAGDCAASVAVSPPLGTVGGPPEDAGVVAGVDPDGGAPVGLGRPVDVRLAQEPEVVPALGRAARIAQEIAEIVGGSAALE